MSTPQSFGELTEQLCSLISSAAAAPDSTVYVNDLLSRFEQRVQKDTSLSARKETPSKSISSVLMLCAA
jgi:hypothetical protein